MLIATKVVSSNRTHAEAYSIQLYVIEFANYSDLQQVGGIFRVLCRYTHVSVNIPSTNATPAMFTEWRFNFEMNTCDLLWRVQNGLCILNLHCIIN